MIKRLCSAYNTGRVLGGRGRLFSSYIAVRYALTKRSGRFRAYYKPQVPPTIGNPMGIRGAE